MRGNVHGLVGKIGGVLHSQVNHGEGEEQTGDGEAPGGEEDVHVWDLDTISSPDTSSTGGLDSLVESREVSKLGGVVGHSTLEVVSGIREWWRRKENNAP